MPEKNHPPLDDIITEEARLRKTLKDDEQDALTSILVSEDALRVQDHRHERKIDALRIAARKRLEDIPPSKKRRKSVTFDKPLKPIPTTVDIFDAQLGPKQFIEALRQDLSEAPLNLDNVTIDGLMQYAKELGIVFDEPAEARTFEESIGRVIDSIRSSRPDFDDSDICKEAAEAARKIESQIPEIQSTSSDDEEDPTVPVIITKKPSNQALRQPTLPAGPAGASMRHVRRLAAPADPHSLFSSPRCRPVAITQSDDPFADNDAPLAPMPSTAMKAFPIISHAASSAPLDTPRRESLLHTSSSSVKTPPPSPSPDDRFFSRGTQTDLTMTVSAGQGMGK